MNFWKSIEQTIKPRYCRTIIKFRLVAADIWSAATSLWWILEGIVMTTKRFLKNIEGYITAGMLAVMLVLLFIQVLSRWAGNSNSWSEELSRYLFVWVIYLGGSLAIQTDSHVKIDILVNIWPKKIRPYILLIGQILLIVYCGCIGYYAACFTYNLYMAKTISIGLGISMAFAYASVPVGYCFMAIRVLQFQIIPQIRSIKTSSCREKKDDETKGGTSK